MTGVSPTRHPGRIWESTFVDFGFQVQQTTKQELAKTTLHPWGVMLCMDLFDGKNNCIDPQELPRMKRWQRINRLVGLRKTLWNKDKFCETMGSALHGYRFATHVEQFVFPCWVLPKQFESMLQDIQARHGPETQFILKPTDRGEGNGIRVVDHASKLKGWKEMYPSMEEIVVQTYLNRPLLIDRRRFFALSRFFCG